jgi:hypothetical protein
MNLEWEQAREPHPSKKTKKTLNANEHGKEKRGFI